MRRRLGVVTARGSECGRTEVEVIEVHVPHRSWSQVRVVVIANLEQDAEKLESARKRAPLPEIISGNSWNS
jgi:hypothetical protein